MLKEIHPKLPMRDKNLTKQYYVDGLGFQNLSDTDYEGYLMLQKDMIQIHFFEFKDLDPNENYGQVYIRVSDIEDLYKSFLDKHIAIHPNGSLESKPWGQKEFSILDPDNNLITFGEKSS